MSTLTRSLVPCAFALAMTSARAFAAPPVSDEESSDEVPSDAAPGQPSDSADAELDASEDFGDLLNTEIVSTASRAAEDANQAPGTLTVITAEEIALLGLTTVADAINYFGLGLGYQATGGQEGAASLTARGVGVGTDAGKHVLVLINGHTVNETWGGWVWLDDLFTLPLEAVDRIEILNGPGSVLYGTNAMYGVINLVTKSAEAQAGLSASMQGHVALPGDQNNALTAPGDGNRMGWGTRSRLGFALPFALGDRNGEFFVQLLHVERRAPTHVYGPQTPDWDPGPNHYPNGDWGGIAGPRRMSNGGMIGFRLGDWALDLQGGYWRRHNVNDYQSDFGDTFNLEHWGELRVDLRNNTSLREGMRLSSRVFGDYYGYLGTWSFTDPAYCGGVIGRCAAYDTNDAGRFGLEEVFEADWFVDGKLVTTIGGDAQGRFVHDRAGFMPYRGEITPDSVQLQYFALAAAGALFVQQRYQPVHWFGLNAGLRLDMDQLFGAHLSPRVATTFTPIAGTTLQLLYSEAFRAPQIGELMYSDSTTHVSARSLGGLRPEVVRSGEFAFEQRLPRGIGSFRLGSYVSWYRDLVTRRTVTAAEYEEAVADGRLRAEADPNYATTYDNIGRIFAFGGYATLRLQTPARRFRFGTNVQAGDATLVRDVAGLRMRSQVPIAPRVTGNAHVMLVPGKAAPRLALALYYASPRRTEEDIAGEFVDVQATRAGHHVQGRLAITGEIEKPKSSKLSWGIWADYTLARRGPYLIGQLTYSDGMRFPGELDPLDRLSIWAGLTWQFDVVGAAKRARASK